MLELTPIFVTAIVFGFVFGIIYLRVRRKERMALIGKETDASMLTGKQSFNFYAFKIGLLMICVAVGLILGAILSAITLLNNEAV